MTGRQEEQARIHKLLQSERSEFLAVTGRRRVGKTFLIDSLLKEHYCFSMTGIQNGDTATQLLNFSIKLAEYQGRYPTQPPKNWQLAFQQFKQYLKTLDRHQKQVIFIDELPWVATARSGFLQLLAHLWNDYLSKEPHFLLVICGSATSWISQKVINDPGGLHNRLTETIHLHPFTLSETATFLKRQSLAFTDQGVAQLYMILGGIPFYLEQVRKGESVAVAVERLCFSPQGILQNEYNNLLRALFKNPELHERIVQVLASRPYGMTSKAILEKLSMSQPTGSYQRALEELIASDFIHTTLPFGKKKRGLIYRLVDEYCVFYHRFIAPMSQYSPGIWQQQSESQSYKIWAGYAFENLCHKHISEIKSALGISAVFTQTTAVREEGDETYPGFQIDLLIDRKDQAINLYEVKYRSGPYTITKATYQKLLELKNLLRVHTGTEKQVFLTLITNHGLVQNAYANEVVDALVTLEDLIHPGSTT